MPVKMVRYSWYLQVPGVDGELHVGGQDFYTSLLDYRPVNRTNKRIWPYLLLVTSSRYLLETCHHGLDGLCAGQ
jgi:hypothetical protein